MEEKINGVNRSLLLGDIKLQVHLLERLNNRFLLHLKSITLFLAFFFFFVFFLNTTYIVCVCVCV